MGGTGLYAITHKMEKDEDCPVCGLLMAPITINKATTLQGLIDAVAASDDTFRADVGAMALAESTLYAKRGVVAAATEGNLPKTVWDLFEGYDTGSVAVNFDNGNAYEPEAGCGADVQVVTKEGSMSKAGPVPFTQASLTLIMQRVSAKFEDPADYPVVWTGAGTPGAGEASMPNFERKAAHVVANYLSGNFVGNRSYQYEKDVLLRAQDAMRDCGFAPEEVKALRARVNGFTLSVSIVE
jgi:hypothetical protein